MDTHTHIHTHIHTHTHTHTHTNMHTDDLHMIYFKKPVVMFMADEVQLAILQDLAYGCEWAYCTYSCWLAHLVNYIGVPLGLEFFYSILWLVKIHYMYCSKFWSSLMSLKWKIQPICRAYC